MQNSALNHMMATQTNILEEIREMRRKEDMRSQFSATTPPPAEPISTQPMMDNSIQTPMMNTDIVPTQQPISQIEMFDGNKYYDTMAPTPNMQMGMAMPGTQPVMNNPLSYQSVSSLPMVGGVAGLTHNTVTDALTYDRSRMSKEATANHFAEKSQSVQMGAVETAGKAVEMGGMASGFLAGGMIGGLAVGSVVGASTAYVAGAMVDGAKTSLAYQDILRKDGYKAFNALESTTEYGGVGMKLDDQQELSGFMRDLSDENFLEDSEMSEILQGSLDNKLLKSVSDVKSFKEKFSGIVSSVKEISLTLNQSIDEAIEFMGEMERRGVSSKDVTNIAAGSKVAASFLGIDATQYTQQMMAQTDSIVGGTSIDASNVMTGIGQNSYMLSAVEELSSSGDGILKQYIKNRGGSAEVSGEVEGLMRNYYNGAGQDKLLGMFSSAFEQDDSGNFSLNKSKLDELLGSGMSHRELLQESADYRRTLGLDDQAKLARSAGDIFNQSATSSDMYGVLNKVQEQFQTEMGPDVDGETALISMGLTSDDTQARLMDDLIAAGTDKDSAMQYNALTLKEQMDSAKNADSPGIFKRMKFWGKRTFSNPIGDAGQFISDGVGDITQDIQMATSGIGETGRLGGEMLGEINEESVNNMFVGENSNMGRVQDILSGLDSSVKGDPLKDQSVTEKQNLSSGEFKRLMDNVKGGRMSSSELAKLRENLSNDVYDRDTKQQIEYALNTAQGDYDGVLGSIRQTGAWLTQKTDLSGLWSSGGSGSEFESKEEIEKQQKSLKDDLESSSKDLNKLMSSGKDLGVSSDSYEELEEKIRAGDLAGVKKLTDNKKVIGLTEEFGKHVGKRDKLNEASDLYTEAYRTTAGTLEMTGGVFDFIEASGIYSEEEFDSYFGDERKDIEKQLKKDGKKLSKKSDQELLGLNKEYLTKGMQAFENMSDGERLKAAEFLTSAMPSINIEELYGKGTEKVDAAKLYDSFMDVSRVQQADSSAAKGAITGSEEAVAASEEHLETMNAFVSTFVAETGKLNTAIEDLKTKNYGKYTGVNS